MQARLTTDTAFGLHLTIWTLLLLMGVWLFAPIVEDVLTTELIVVVDQVVAHWLHTHTTSWLTSGMRAISTLAALPAGLTMTSLLALILAARGCWYTLVKLVLVVPGSMLLNVLTKNVFDRPRPSVTDPPVRLSSYSFPSGHTAAATLFYGLLMVVALRHVRGWRGRLVIVAASAVIVGLVGRTASTSGPII